MLWNDCKDKDAYFDITCSPRTFSALGLVSIAADIKTLNKSRPVSFEIAEVQNVPQIYAPIAESVVGLNIRSCVTKVPTAKLPSLKIPNLLLFTLTDCNTVTVRKDDFSSNTKLRMIMFQNSTIQTLETGTFMNLPDLRFLSLEYEWRRSQPLKEEYKSHLLRFHCSPDYTWFRKWLNENPGLIAWKKDGEVYQIGNFQSLSLGPAYNQTYVPVDCKQRDLPNFVPNSKQSSYSVNDGLIQTDNGATSSLKIFLSVQLLCLITALLR